MSDDLEKLAIHYATYAGLRWGEMDEAHRDHYRHSARMEMERRAATPPREPEMMPPIRI